MKNRYKADINKWIKIFDSLQNVFNRNVINVEEKKKKKITKMVNGKMMSMLLLE